MSRYSARRRRRRSRAIRRGRSYASTRASYVPRLPCRTAWPSTMKVKLKHSFSFTVTSGTYENWNYAMNSLYAPLQTGGSGKQPYGFDQWTEIYEDYLVTHSAISVIFGTTHSSTPHRVCILPTRSNPGVDVNQLIERPYCVYGEAMPNERFELKNEMPLSTFLGKLDQSSHGGTANTSPTEMPLWCIGFSPFGIAWNISVVGTIVYTAVFSNPQNVPQS